MQEGGNRFKSSAIVAISPSKKKERSESPSLEGCMARKVSACVIVLVRYRTYRYRQINPWYEYRYEYHNAPRATYGCYCTSTVLYEYRRTVTLVRVRVRAQDRRVDDDTARRDGAHEQRMNIPLAASRNRNARGSYCVVL